MHFKLLKNKIKPQEKTVLKTQKNNKKTQEKSRGRSMVEMLGVLAIIGVLSIGGIQGYTLAMRRYRANEILNTMQKYATVLYTSCRTSLLNKQNETKTFWSMEVKEGLMCDNLMEFSQSGLGGLPNGIIGVTGFLGMPISLSSDKIISPPIIRTKSGDIVRLYVHVNSKELCETILDISGTVEYIGNDGLCEKSNIWMELFKRDLPQNDIDANALKSDVFVVVISFIMK